VTFPKHWPKREPNRTEATRGPPAAPGAPGVPPRGGLA